ncbi:MAG: hypothetical protein TR69_WS6001000832 [candidate division WS6 bacterium OLB20]|uniref:Nucleoside 2-deoxyribosyltransferase n=1 Tax=candidate division WS6 bacterium OLB20 TaxID=1617426 RepID=A0A136LYT3_9BACT|nr:MAG: hypothetical protein TR69_WS6001000832 [candidate division WS6 bacterium OLB20]
MKAGIIGVKYDDELYPTYKLIKELIEKSGNKVDFTYFETSAEEDYKDLEGTHKRNQSLLKTNDFIIAETTNYGSGIGYLIAQALNEKKPVLALYNPEKGEKPSAIIKESANKSRLLHFSEYTDSTLEGVIKTFLSDLKKVMDTKFILIISPEIERYLEWVSDERRMHKAQVVRQAVEETIEKDKEYQEYLKGEYGEA